MLKTRFDKNELVFVSLVNGDRIYGQVVNHEDGFVSLKRIRIVGAFATDNEIAIPIFVEWAVGVNDHVALKISTEHIVAIAKVNDENFRNAYISQTTSLVTPDR